VFPFNKNVAKIQPLIVFKVLWYPRGTLKPYKPTRIQKKLAVNQENRQI